MGRSFTTSTGLAASWPEAPESWSHSSLCEVEACARRYALRRATYEGVWGRSGYPDTENEASLVGSAVHHGVELVLKAMSTAGVRSVREAGAVEVLRSLGGLTAIAQAGVQAALDGLDENPRMAPRLEQLKQRLDRRVGEMRTAIQTFVSRATLVPSNRPEGAGGLSRANAGRVSLGAGTHSEIELRAEDVRIMGRIDLLTVQTSGADLVDFKTGEPSETHADQLRLYGFLWIADQIVNPAAIPVASLTVAYQEREVAVDVPHEWTQMELELLARVEKADRALMAESPAATPSADCRYCSVRHMCDAYWASEHVPDAGSRGEGFVDAQLIVRERHGPTSWRAQADGTATPTLLRLPTSLDADKLAPDVTVRVLGCLIGEDRDADHRILTLTQASEIFRLTTGVV